VDRTPRNPNLLRWHRRLYLIDHGAAFYFHHTWADYPAQSRTPFARIKDHVLLPFAAELAAADVALRSRLGAETLAAIVGLVPDAWLAGEAAFPDLTAQRAAYVDYLTRRLDAADAFVGEANRARALTV
jgi:hypothetical protein